MKKPIGIATAKAELARINDNLEAPHLLIGGLAVQQYQPTRNSKDIDLICDFERLQKLLSALYPNKEWKIEDERDDEYRPSYRITHKHSQELGEIIFGPKISERGSYKYLNWDILAEGARPFRYGKRLLDKILVPAPHALAYSKFISFIARVEENPSKGAQDLRDFADLTNSHEFLSERFHGLINSADKDRKLIDEFRLKSDLYQEVLSGSHLHDLASLFSNPEWSSPSSQFVGKKTDLHHLEGFWTSAWVYGKESCEDLLEIIEIRNQVVVGRRAAKTEKFQYRYQVTGVSRGERLHLIAQPRTSNRPFAVSLVLQAKDKFGEELEGIAIRPAANERPDPPMPAALFDEGANFWASKVTYTRVDDPTKHADLWRILNQST